MNYRLFIALDTPVEISRHIHSICTGFDSISWVSRDQIHLTLRFIGEADGLLLEDICQCLSEIQSPGFTLKLKGVGHFPPRGEPKVLWAGLEDSQALEKLFGKINRALDACGIAREKRKFSPHITLGRVREGSSAIVAEYLSRHNRFKSESFEVPEFHLYNSFLTPKGAVHERLASFLLDNRL